MELKECPCCGKNKFSIKYSKLYDKDFLKEGEFNLMKCDICGLEILRPMLNEKQLKKYYPEEEYYSYGGYNPLAFKYHLFSAYYHSGKSKIFRSIFKIISPILYTYYIDEGKSILEVGCGNGMKLEIYQKYGMKTSGIDPYGPQLSEKEKKLGIIRKSIDKNPYRENSFDYIILKEVLEHIPNQKSVLDKCYRWLKHGGKLIITVPNTQGLWNKIFKKNWCGYDVPRHLYNYNPKNLSFILKKNGFKLNKLRVYDMPYMFDGSIKFWITSKTKNRKYQKIFSNFMKIVSLPLNLFVTYLNKGSIIEVQCSK